MIIVKLNVNGFWGGGGGISVRSYIKCASLKNFPYYVFFYVCDFLCIFHKYIIQRGAWCKARNTLRY